MNKNPKLTIKLSMALVENSTNILPLLLTRKIVQ